MHRCKRDCRGKRSLLPLLMAHGGNEIVAPPRDGDDVAMTTLSVAEGAPQRADLNLQVRLFDKGLWPGAGDQLFVMAGAVRIGGIEKIDAQLAGFCGGLDGDVGNDEPAAIAFFTAGRSASSSSHRLTLENSARSILRPCDVVAHG